MSTRSVEVEAVVVMEIGGLSAQGVTIPDGVEQVTIEGRDLLDAARSRDT